MTDSTNNPNAGQSDDPQNRDALQQQARKEASKPEGERDTTKPHQNPGQGEHNKPGAAGAPQVNNPE